MATIACLCVSLAAIGDIQAAQTPAPQTESAAQAAPAAAAKAPDYSNQPLVLEKWLTTITCDANAICTVENSARARIQSAAGVQAFGNLDIQYASASSAADFVSVKVTKPDGRVVTTDPADALAIPADVTREAPEYSDLQEKQLAVRGLEAGDTLEYQTVVRDTAPLDPGQFWYFYNFTKGAIVLSEELRFIAPKNRHVNFKSIDVQPTVTLDGANSVYDWKSSNLSDADSGKKTPAPQIGLAPPPDILISSFDSWDQVGQWFRGLA
ncbi:MAG: DUF3857 domain-containing protein, partial [Candidatus Acidiferrales bacterium]